MLRPVTDADVEIFFGFQLDAEAAAMIPLPVRDHATHAAHWARIRADAETVTQTIEVDGQVAGNLLCFVHDGRRVIGYWIGRAFWGRGIATRALTEFLAAYPERPLHATVAATNAGSLRVLDKCGFTVVDRHTGDDGVEEVLLKHG
jgi:RimJ/RimL family protein N-acetyltransferase